MKYILINVLLLIFVQGYSQTQNNPTNKMKPLAVHENINKTNNKMSKVTVWDTYVTKKDGTVMHFDIVAPEDVKDTTVIYGYGKEYLKTKCQEGQPLTSKECRRCHVRDIQPQWEADIKKQGYFIIEMENCK